MSKPILGYWDIRCYAEPVRHMLKYAGVDFIDKRYGFEKGFEKGAGAPGHKDFYAIRDQWFREKFTHNLDFPNLPYYIDGDIRISQTLAITRYVARKYGLYAEDEVSLARQDMAEQQIRDFQYSLIYRAVYVEDYKRLREVFIKEELPKQLALLSKFLGERKWFIGDKLTYIDFLAWETFDWMRLFSPGCLDGFANLVAFMKRFEQIPQIAAYQKSSEFKNWPIYSPGPPWGYDK